MADGVEFSITGLESLLGKLDSVSYDVRRKGGRAALRKAAQVVVQKAKEGAERIDDYPNVTVSGTTVSWSFVDFSYPTAGNLVPRRAVNISAGTF